MAYAGGDQQETSKLLVLGSGPWSAQCEVLRIAKHQLEGWKKKSEGRCDDADAVTLALFHLSFKETMECLLRGLTSSVPRVSQSAVECLSLLLECTINRATIDAQEEAVVMFLKRALSEPCMAGDNTSSRLLADAIHSLIHHQSLSVNMQLFSLLVKKVLAAPPLFTSTTYLRFLQAIISLHPTEVLRQPDLMGRLLEVVHFCVADRSASLLRVAKDIMLQCVQFDRAATAQALRGLQASKRAVVMEWLVGEHVDSDFVRMVASSSRLSPSSQPSLLTPTRRPSLSAQTAPHAEAMASLRKSPGRRLLSRPAMAPLSLNASLLSGVQSRIPSQTASQPTSRASSLLGDDEQDITHEDIDEPSLARPSSNPTNPSVPPESTACAKNRVSRPSTGNSTEHATEDEAVLHAVASTPSTEVLPSSLVFRSA